MKERILENWKTTALGVVVVAACLTFIWFDKFSLAELSPFLIGSVYPILHKKKKKDEAAD